MSRATEKPNKSHTGIAFHHPLAFWAGTFAIMGGVLIGMPEFFSQSARKYQIVGLDLTPIEFLGFFMILGGLAAAVYGLFPRKETFAAMKEAGAKIGGYHFRAMDDAPLTRAHYWLLFVLGVALIIDVMKPASLGFSIPGIKKEYGISTARAAIFPFAALTGTTIGSFLWGMLADRLGRRAAILLASLMFMATATCSLMPAFQINVGMCFVMGLSAGGMLPIVYALMAESVPAKKRGWLVVLHGGMGTVGGFLAASGATALLVPHFGWRILWFLNLPTGAILLILNRWIPESPRFLLERGLVNEAGHVTARYGVILERTAPGVASTGVDPILNGGAHGSLAGLGKLFRQPHLGQTVTVGLYGLGWGLVNWGFLTFLPTILDDIGLQGKSASSLLFLGALLSIPGTVLVSYMYGMWSTKKSMIIFALATSLTLVGFATLNPAGPGRGWVLTLLVAALLVTSGGVIAMLSPYTAEVYPTTLRGTGSGLAAGSSKLGGILGPPVAAAVLSFFPGIGGTALVAAVPISLAGVVVGLKGVETRGRRLEEISSGGKAAKERV